MEILEIGHGEVAVIEAPGSAEVAEVEVSGSELEIVELLEQGPPGPPAGFFDTDIALIYQVAKL